MSDTIAAQLRELLELTATQHGTKRRIDLLRARIDEHARTSFEKDGVAPSWKIGKLGQIRLDGATVDPDPVPVIQDQAAFTSWLAQRHPTEAIATLEVPADQLEAALELLRFGEVKVDATRLEARPAGVTRVMADLVIEETTEEGATERTWLVVNEGGEVVDGVTAHLPEPRPKLVVAVDPKRKAKAELEADTADAEAFPPPAEEPEAEEKAS